MDRAGAYRPYPCCVPGGQIEWGESSGITLQKCQRLATLTTDITAEVLLVKSSLTHLHPSLRAHKELTPPPDSALRGSGQGAYLQCTAGRTQAQAS